jgi:hypothetical protein
VLAAYSLLSKHKHQMNFIATRHVDGYTLSFTQRAKRRTPPRHGHRRDRAEDQAEEDSQRPAFHSLSVPRSVWIPACAGMTASFSQAPAHAERRGDYATATVVIAPPVRRIRQSRMRSGQRFTA